MRLEDEIKQSRFASEQSKASVNFLFTYHWLQGRIHTIFDGFEVTPQQYNILRILRGQYPTPCTIQLLKDRMLDKQPDVSRLVDRLVAKEWVERKVCQGDRRKMDVAITSSGLELLEQMHPSVQKIDDCFNMLTEGELNQLYVLLDKLRG